MRLVEPEPSPWVIPNINDDCDDLVALGADLEPGTILAAYRSGLFPMPIKGHLGWWSPNPRGVLPLASLRISRSLRKSCEKFDIRIDSSFEAVMRACAEPDRKGGWITEDFVESYQQLFEMGWCHSIESWNRETGELAGGLYGIAINGLFAGESMFHRETDASKVALVALVDLLNDSFSTTRLLDVQWATEHLSSLGVVEITRNDYLAKLNVALELPHARFE